MALDRWQSAKGLAVAAFLLAVFLFTSWPREVVALAGAGLLLMSRRMHSRRMLGLVDWELLVLFTGLFVVNDALQRRGVAAAVVAATLLLSNLLSNVPAVMLLLPVATRDHAGTLLALVSTLAGNLLVVGSIANIIVVDAALRRGIRIGWREHGRVGVPVTVATLAIAAAWLAVPE